MRDGTRYEISGWFKGAEEDIFNDGCQPDTFTCFDGDDIFTGKDPEEAIQAFADFVGADAEDIERDACDEDGRIDISVMETEEGHRADDDDIEGWKAGRMRLWYATYTGHLHRVTRETVSVART